MNTCMPEPTAALAYLCISRYINYTYIFNTRQQTILIKMPRPSKSRPESASTPTIATGVNPKKTGITSGAGAGTGAVRWSQERRLQFIDFRLQWEGRINRRDVTEFFNISVPQASADIARYTELAPQNLQYDTSSRTYTATPGFSPYFEATGPRQYLSQLLALERQILTSDQVFLAFRPPMASVPLPSRAIEPKILTLMLQAIAQGGKLQIRYQSITREEDPVRFISPHAFGYDGARWHVRAYCHLREGFRDFVFGRILSAEPPIASSIDPVSDREWHTQVDLVLVPDDSLAPKQRQGVEIDYGMQNGRVTIACRQAMLFYTLRTLNFELNGSPRQGERQLIIANLTEIKSLLPKPGQA